MVVRLDPCDLGLLQHELGDEHAIWVPGPTPRQVATVSAEPAKEAALEIRGSRC